MSFLRETYVFNFSARPAGLVDEFRLYYGPTMNAFEAAEKDGPAEALRQELVGLFESQNRSPEKARVHSRDLLRVTVTV